jgi:hypothetical protein
MSAQLEVPYLEAEVEGRLSTLIERTDAEIEQLKRTRSVIDNKITLLVRKRKLWEATVNALSARAEDGTADDAWRLRLVTGEQPAKPRAVVAFLSEHPDRAFRLIEIRHALIARGWMDEGQRSAHALEVAVRTLQARGEIERPRRGVYRIAAPSLPPA